MKAHLRLMGEIRPEKQRSAVSNEQSVLYRWFPAKSWLLPKTYYLIPFLFLVFVSCGAVLAQESVVQTTPAAKAETEITPLKIGDKIPDELWEMYFPVVSASSDQVQYLSLGDFKDKLIILDFWATWCGSCISSLHKLDSLQKEFEGDLVVVPTSYEPKEKVQPFLKKHTLDLPSLVNEQELRKYFAYRTIPHQIWVKDGKVKAITGNNESTIENIQTVLSDSEVSFKEKRDLNVDFFEPISTYAKQRGADIIFQSLLTGHIEGTGGVGRKKNDSTYVYYFLNRPILYLYDEALKIPLNQVVLESENIDRFFYNDGDDYDNVFCYQLFLPLIHDQNAARHKIITDFNEYFNLNGRYESREVQCYVIEGEGKDLPINLVDTSEKAYPMKNFTGLLNYHEEWRPDLLRIIDESNFKGKFWAKYPRDLSKLKNDLNELSTYLSSYGLSLTKAKRNLEFFVITDSNK